MAATKRKRSLRPSFEEANAPSGAWTAQRTRLLGSDPDLLRGQLVEQLRVRGNRSSAHKLRAHVVQAAVDKLDGLIADADERIAVARFRDALTSLVQSGAADAALARQSELEHGLNLERQQIGRNEKESIQSRRRRIAAMEGSIGPEIEFAAQVAAFLSAVQAKRDALSERAKPVGRSFEALTEIAAVLAENGLSHVAIAQVLGTTWQAVEQRLRRRRKLHARADAIVARAASHIRRMS